MGAKARESGEEGGGRAGEGCLLHEMLGEFGVASAMLGHACRPRGAEAVGVRSLGMETKISVYRAGTERRGAANAEEEVEHWKGQESKCIWRIM